MPGQILRLPEKGQTDMRSSTASSHGGSKLINVDDTSNTEFSSKQGQTEIANAPSGKLVTPTSELIELLDQDIEIRMHAYGFQYPDLKVQLILRSVLLICQTERWQFLSGPAYY